MIAAGEAVADLGGQAEKAAKLFGTLSGKAKDFS
jgi:hypothetical protein